jgi:pimeloyl-ACP methyl ester carboxylesterase
MKVHGLLLALGLTAGLVVPGAAAAPPLQPAAVATPLPGPPLREDPAKLAASLSCTAGVTTSSTPTVLLVPGTLTSPDQDWGKNLATQLPKRGYQTCMVAQPTHALNDMQVSVEYVVSAIRALYSRSGGKVAVIGHSQGAFLATYALRFWPDLALKVSDFIGYAGTYTYGFDLAETLCTAPCTEALQQFRPGSRLLTGVAAQPLPSGPGYTAYSTNVDEMVRPQPLASTLHAPSVRNYVLQDLCPFDLADHLLIPFEKPFLALTLDALRNPGPGAFERIGRAPCGLLTGAPQAVPGLVTSVALGAVAGAQNTATAEPPLRCYLDANCP